MSYQIQRLLDDPVLMEQVKSKLPALFLIANKECSKNNKLGMEVGTTREKIIIALLIHLFGSTNAIPNNITEQELDVTFFGERFSIKTFSTKTSSTVAEVKVSWTADTQSASNFYNNYSPSCHMLLVHICWGYTGAIYYIPLDVQRAIMSEVGRSNYLKPPTPGRNTRGSTIPQRIVRRLITHHDTIKIGINWSISDVEHNPYARWLNEWEEAIPTDRS
jgi:hypothetical protein